MAGTPWEFGLSIGQSLVPHWMVWIRQGLVAVPWICATAFTVYLSLFVIKDQEFRNEEDQKK